MPNPEHVVLVVREWVVKAENDLKTAVHTLEMGKECPPDVVCFHAQQCVEKYLKAFLVLEGIYFPKTHAIEDLVSLIPGAARPKLAKKVQERLTDYATVTRYPGDYEPIKLAEARRAVQIARRVRSDVRKRLPKSARSETKDRRRRRK